MSPAEETNSATQATVNLIESPPLPVVTVDNETFWQSCVDHELRLQRCAKCDQFWFPPASICPQCWGTDWAWAPVSGRGRIFTFTVFRRLYHKAYREALPYATAVIELDEGPRFLSRLVNVADLDALECGQRVTILYEDYRNDYVLPVFEPADS